MVVKNENSAFVQRLQELGNIRDMEAHFQRGARSKAKAMPGPRVARELPAQPGVKEESAPSPSSTPHPDDEPEMRDSGGEDTPVWTRTSSEDDTPEDDTPRQSPAESESARNQAYAKLIQVCKDNEDFMSIYHRTSLRNMRIQQNTDRTPA